MTLLLPTTAAGPAVPPTLTGRRYRGVPLALGGLVTAAALIISPGPDIADVHDATWVPAHALHTVGFLLILLGVPAVAGSIARRLDTVGVVLGTVGYTALMVRCATSAGSHLYSLWILPQLAKHPELSAATNADHGGLASIYAGHGDLIDAVLGVGFLALAVAFWRCGRSMRTVAILTLLFAAGEFIGLAPLALPLLSIVAIWLGLRLVVRDNATSPLRTPKSVG